MNCINVISHCWSHLIVVIKLKFNSLQIYYWRCSYKISFVHKKKIYSTFLFKRLNRTGFGFFNFHSLPFSLISLDLFSLTFVSLYFKYYYLFHFLQFLAKFTLSFPPKRQRIPPKIRIGIKYH